MKRAQEEMVGFVLIFIIISIVALFAIGFLINKGSGEKEDKDYSTMSLLNAILQYSTDCANLYEPNYYSVRGLISACEEEKKCLDGRKSCEVLKNVISDILNKTIIIGNESRYKGYEFKMFSENSKKIEIISGKKTKNYAGALEILSGNEKITIILRIYY